MQEKAIHLNSEIGSLERVVVHSPGQEIENMTPDTAAEVLYDDIVNLSHAKKEHSQLKSVLNQFSEVLELKNLLADVLQQSDVKLNLLKSLCSLFRFEELIESLCELDVKTLTSQLIEGTLMPKNSLERYLNPSLYALPPLPNTFFTRDATMCVNDRVIIGSMAHRVRVAEALILKNIFSNHPALQGAGFYFDGTKKGDERVTIEGGDLLIIREDLAIIGYSDRTSVAGIDHLLRSFAKQGKIKNVIVVEIPKTRATIHLDMIFTMVDVDKAVVFPSLITGINRCRVYQVSLESNKIKVVNETLNLLKALEQQNIHVKPISCGGNERLSQEREQWGSGANFFTIKPGIIIGYGHNIRTIESLNNNGFDVLSANETIKSDITNITAPTVITIEGVELSRGGGGCRCMTMPIKRKEVAW